VVVGVLGNGVPEEVLVAAGAETIAIEGSPGGATDLADRYVEPMVGPRARSQLQRLLDGTYAGLDLIVCSRETEAPLRLFYSLRELRRLEPDRGVPPVHVVDLQHLGTDATRRWNAAQVRSLCAAVGAREDRLPDAIAACNERRRPRRPAPEGRRRVFVTGSEHADTGLGAALEAAGASVVDGPPILTGEGGDPVEAIARRYEHPLLAGARGSSARKAEAVAEAARAAGADAALAFYLEGDDGLRWEYPECRDALERAGIPVTLREQQPYDLAGLAW
jgi:hypothetical protein